MKNVFLILLFLTLSVSYGQNFSKKWNSTYQRYDYSDSNGYLMGYEKWNSTYQRWDYTVVNTNANRPAQVRQPIERGDINYDTKILLEKQRRYDINKAKLDEFVLSGQQLIFAVGKSDAKVSYEEAKRVNDIYLSSVKNLLNKNYDLSSNAALQYIIDTISSYPIKLTCKEWNICKITTD